MAVNRMDAGKESGEKADKAPASSAPRLGNEAGGGLKAWLPLIVTLVTMPVVAYAVTNFVLLPKLQHGLGVAGGRADGSAKPANGHGREASLPKQTYPMVKLLVNVANTMGQRYLLASLTLVGSDPDFKTRLEARNDQLRDVAMAALSTKTLPDLEKPGVRNLLRSELITAFNNVLGSSSVEEIYVTEFAIQ